jgi:polyphosphate kinase 2 (PPK2 family)
MSILSQVNLNQALTDKEYQEQLVRHQVALSQLAYQVYVQKRPVVIVFEGWDAAGKGGAIKRLTERLDPRGYVVYPIAAPAGEDKTHHYLYRFWRRLPDRGQIAVFDRSWYGRVMVERIEGFCTEAEWKRAYREINQFERQLADFGTIIFKFWMHISKDEQLRRFEERQNTPYKAWKLTAEDWRNREKWEQYEVAVEEMLLKTSTVTAPWTIVEGNDKAWSRIKVLKTVVETLSRELDYQPDILAAKPDKAAKKSKADEGEASADKRKKARKDKAAETKTGH